MADGSGFHGTGRVPRAARQHTTGDPVEVVVRDANLDPRGGAVVDAYIGGWRTGPTVGALDDGETSPEATVAYCQAAAPERVETGADGVATFPPVAEWTVAGSDERENVGAVGSSFDSVYRDVPTAVDPLDRPYETQVTFVAAYPGPDRAWFGAERVLLANALETTPTVYLDSERLFGPRPLTADVDTDTGQGTLRNVRYGAVTMWRSVPGPGNSQGDPRATPDDRHHLYVEVDAGREYLPFDRRQPRTDAGERLYTGPAGDSVFESRFPTIDAIYPYNRTVPVAPTPPVLGSGTLRLHVEENAGVTVPGPASVTEGREAADRTAEGPFVLDDTSETNWGMAAFARATAYAFAGRSLGPLAEDGESHAAPLWPALRGAFRRWRPVDAGVTFDGSSVADAVTNITKYGPPAAKFTAGAAEVAERARLQYVAGITGEALDSANTAVGLFSAAVDLADAYGPGSLGELPLANDLGAGAGSNPNDRESWEATWSFGRDRSTVVARIPLRFDADEVTVGVTGGWTAAVDLYPPATRSEPIRALRRDRIAVERTIPDRRVPGGGGGGS